MTIIITNNYCPVLRSKDKLVLLIAIRKQPKPKTPAKQQKTMKSFFTSSSSKSSSRAAEETGGQVAEQAGGNINTTLPLLRWSVKVVAQLLPSNKKYIST
jgi:hypothetical protein